MGGVAIYDRPLLIDTILERLASGESLNAICQTTDFPAESTVRFWVTDDAEFAAKYARARSVGIDALAERGVAVAADQSREPNCRRVELEAIRWFTGKMRPDKYGDNSKVEVTGNLVVSVAETLRAKRAERLKTLDAVAEPIE